MVSRNIRNILFPILKTALVVFLLVFTVTESVPAQRSGYDYEEYPPMPFRFNKLDLDLKVDPSERVLEGIANYTLTSTLAGADQIKMNASQIEVSGVILEGEETNYSLQNDTLVIGLPEPADRDQTFDITINYTAAPTFGLHWNNASTVWTSTLPYSVSHWLPVYDHPRTRMETNLAISHPDTLITFATGKRADSKTDETEDGFQITTWKSGKSVSATDIHFGVGEFQSSDIRYGVKNINLFTEGDFLDEEIKNELLDTTYSYLQNMEDRLDYEYPYSSLNIVFLEDHKWDSKPYGASVIYLYENGGDYKVQLRRGIIAQWIGVQKKEVQWLDADAMMLYQSWLYNTGGNSSAELSPYSEYPESDQFTLYEKFRASEWNRWLSFQQKGENGTFKQALDYTIPLLLENKKNVWSWNDMSRFWYEETGYKWFERFEMPVPENVDTVFYDVKIDYQEMEDKVKLVFEARDSVVDELVDVDVGLLYDDNSDSRNISFSGQRDSLLLNVSSNLQSVELNASEKYPELALDVDKPFEFWLHQLRNHSDKQARKKAAIGIRSYTDNPDLQLALVDAMEQEEDSSVKAEILRTLSATTQGATGTYEMYTDRLSGNALEVRVAALEALKDYPNVDRVTQRVQRYALVSENREMRKAALQTYRHVASPEEFQSVVKRIVNEQDSFSYLIPTILNNLYTPPDSVTESDRELAESLSERFIDKDYSYSVRSEGLKSLIQYDTLKENWRERLPDLLEDTDPRIRYLAVPALEKISEERAENILGNHIFDEYDLRVLGRMEGYLKQFKDHSDTSN